MSKFNKFLIVLGVILVLALIFFVYKQNSSSINYNGYKVYKTNQGYYNIEIYLKNDANPHYISSRYSPKDLEYIPVVLKLKERILKDQLWVTLDKNLTSTSVVALAEITKITANQFLYNIPTHGALTYKKEDAPIKTCEDASPKSTGVVLLKLSDKVKISTKDECIIIEGRDEDEIIKAATRLTLTVLGIMK